MVHETPAIKRSAQTAAAIAVPGIPYLLMLTSVYESLYRVYAWT